MPVISHRSSSSGLSGTYRSNYGSSLDRPYFGTSSYGPRITSYSERFTTRSYTDADGRRVYSRSGSITEDGVTTRYREESREGSLKRESISRDSIREGSALDYPPRDSSLTRSERLSTAGVIDSVAELRNKYSPAHYVPAIYRNKNENISRSKSINDIGLPPIEKSTTTSKKKQSKLDTNGVNEDEQPRLSRVSQYSSYIPTQSGVNGDISRDNEMEINTSTSTPSKSVNRAAPSPGTTRRLAQSEGDEPDAAPITDILDRQRRGSLDSRPLGLVGLRNIGNTCFMNSVIQCLSNTKPLLEYIRKEAYLKDTNTVTSSMKGALIKSFAEVIRELWSGEGGERAVNTASLKGQIQRFAPRFIGYAQQDAQEFLRYLLEGLHEDVNRVINKPKPITTDIEDSLSDKEKATEAWRRYLRMENSFVLDVFVGQLKSTLKCTHCGHCSVTFDPFWDLSLPLPPRSAGSTVRLTHCLDAFTKEETLDGDEKPTCAKCKERRKCTKSFAIQKFPQIMVIHLKRFSPMERFRGKLNTQVEFPLDGLDLSQFAAESHQSIPRYNLYAVSNHSGTPYSGHYTAHCRHPYDHTWHEYNDSRVGSASPRSVVSPEAYVLFYEQESTHQQKSHL